MRRFTLTGGDIGCKASQYTSEDVYICSENEK